jgi:hypothetical protein
MGSASSILACKKFFLYRLVGLANPQIINGEELENIYWQRIKQTEDYVYTFIKFGVIPPTGKVITTFYSQTINPIVCYPRTLALTAADYDSYLDDLNNEFGSISVQARAEHLLLCGKCGSWCVCILCTERHFFATASWFLACMHFLCIFITDRETTKKKYQKQLF